MSSATPEPGETGHPEREAAHEWAAGFRTRRSELRRQMSTGERTLADVFDAADSTDDGSVKLLFVLESLPGAAKVATRRRLAQLGLSETTPVRALGPDQRELVLREFPLRGGTPAVRPTAPSTESSS